MVNHHMTFASMISTAGLHPTSFFDMRFLLRHRPLAVWPRSFLARINAVAGRGTILLLGAALPSFVPLVFRNASAPAGDSCRREYHPLHQQSRRDRNHLSPRCQQACRSLPISFGYRHANIIGGGDALSLD